MIGDPTKDPLPELGASRARFISELGERLTALRQGLARLGTLTESATELNAVRRRLHALGAAADVLGFARSAAALANAEASLSALGTGANANARERVGRVLDLLPSLVLGANIDVDAELEGAHEEPLREPVCIVVYGDAGLESLLHKPGALRGIESHATRQPDQALELVAQLSPDLLLVDADDPNVAEILPRLRQAAGTRHVAVVAVGNFDRPESLSRLMHRGVTRVLPRPTDAATLQRTLRQATLARSGPGPNDGGLSALLEKGGFQRLSADDLVSAISIEARRAFRAPAALESGQSFDFGSGSEVVAALWSAFARIRTLAAHGSDAAVQFPREGPGSAIAIAPGAPAPRSSNAPKSSTPVPLTGRRLIVADDDDAVRTLLAQAFSALGAVVLPARTGIEALELAERHWPDALISDTLMPELDGFALSRHLRADVALSDLPVLLVTWKEHLLECTRNGSSAAALELLDGAGLTAALRDCLAQRAALEQRLAQHDAVHGRLDGLTPRLLLQMVCNRSPNALLSLRSGDLRFEFSIADGRPVHARWYEADAQRAEAHAVLGPFLGVRAGRFSVEPLFAPPAAHFEGDVLGVLNPAVRRVRRATELVQPRSLRSVERVRIEPLLAEQYLLEAPASRALVTQLGSGTPLEPLLTEDAAGSDPGRLSALLGELARRGAVLAVLGHGGRDLLSSPATTEGDGSTTSTASTTNTASTATESNGAPRGSRTSSPAPRGWSPTVSFAAPPAPAIDLRDAVLQAVSAAAEDAPEHDSSSVAIAAESPAGEREPRALPEDAPSAEPEARDAEGRAPSSEPQANAPDAAAADHSAEGNASTPAEAEDAALKPEPEPEPDSNAEARATASSKNVDSAWPAPRGARLRAAFAPLFVSVAAGLLAFLAIRIFAVGASRPPRLPAPAADRGPAPTVAARPRPLAADAGAALQPKPSTATTHTDAAVEFTIELLDLPPRAKLPAGQGLLEVRAWERQQIYVDGAFMGSYDNRVIPLQPGSYRLRLSAGARDAEQMVEVQAGRRTRVSARAMTPP